MRVSHQPNEELVVRVTLGPDKLDRISRATLSPTELRIVTADSSGEPTKELVLDGPDQLKALAHLFRIYDCGTL